MNVLLLTVDDMNYNSIGVCGATPADISPNIDRLAGEGMRFTNSHVTIAVCQPSRSVLLTGRYPHRNGARGFEEIDNGVTTLTEVLSQNGYYNGIIGKENHVAPRGKFAWNEYITTMNEQNGFGRDPQAYYRQTSAFVKNARQADKPFFLMANTHDPHRPFANSEEEVKFFGRNLPVDFEYEPANVEVPGFLPDIPPVRGEIAQYYSSVRRCDQSVGRILDALEDAGVADDTLVLFLSDNGMAFPFAKTNCYLNSTKSPWIFRWPGRIAPGSICEALISGIDFAPTVLDILGLPQIPGMDGTSLMPLLTGQEAEHYETIYTQFFKTARNHITGRERHYPMRCVQDKRYAYIYNAWPDGETIFMNESMSGITFSAMEEAAKSDAAVARRVRFCQYRVREELYDYVDDPDALCNLAGRPEYQSMLDQFRDGMDRYMRDSADELLDTFRSHVVSRK